jgi:ankyrin repeat protein
MNTWLQAIGLTLAMLIVFQVGCRRQENRSFTVLHDAVAKKDIAQVRRWVVERPAYINTIDKHGRTPLCMAASASRVDIAAILIAHGANVNDGSLAYAVANKSNAMVDFLLSKGAVPSGDAMVEAVADNQPEMARFLLSKGADVNSKGVEVFGAEPGVDDPEVVGDRPLLVAIANHNLEMVRFLVANGAKVNTKGLFYYPLGLAAANGDKPIVEFLISNGANPTAKDRGGESALDLAKRNGHQDIVGILEKEMKARKF